jgi:hypothetical protein
MSTPHVGRALDLLRLRAAIGSVRRQLSLSNRELYVQCQVLPLNPAASCELSKMVRAHGPISGLIDTWVQLSQSAEERGVTTWS